MSVAWAGVSRTVPGCGAVAVVDDADLAVVVVAEPAFVTGGAAVVEETREEEPHPVRGIDKTARTSGIATGSWRGRRVAARPWLSLQANRKTRASCGIGERARFTSRPRSANRGAHLEVYLWAPGSPNTPRPSASTATHSETGAHVVASRLPSARVPAFAVVGVPESISAETQLLAPPSGNADVRASPPPSTAMQKRSVAQATPSRAGFGDRSTAATVHEAAPPSGVADAITLPLRSVATHSVALGQATPVITPLSGKTWLPLASTFVCVQVDAPPVGSDDVRRFPA